MKTAALSGAALDWAVAKAEVMHVSVSRGGWVVFDSKFSPSTNWAQGGAIIEREGISICSMEDGQWTASTGELWMPVDGGITGETALIAAMRCYVEAKLGYEVEVPEELLQTV